MKLPIMYFFQVSATSPVLGTRDFSASSSHTSAAHRVYCVWRWKLLHFLTRTNEKLQIC